LDNLKSKDIMPKVMEKKTGFSSFFNWLGRTEMFARPSKQLPGKWQLFEYYLDSNEKLLNFKEESLKENKQSLIMEFNENGKFVRNSNLPIAILQNIDAGEWSISRNFVSLLHPTNFRNNVEFQFAFEKGNLKLLKKDKLGKIEFFGFFKSLE